MIEILNTISQNLNVVLPIAFSIFALIMFFLIFFIVKKKKKRDLFLETTFFEYLNDDLNYKKANSKEIKIIPFPEEAITNNLTLLKKNFFQEKIIGLSSINYFFDEPISLFFNEIQNTDKYSLLFGKSLIFLKENKLYVCTKKAIFIIDENGSFIKNNVINIELVEDLIVNDDVEKIKVYNFILKINEHNFKISVANEENINLIKKIIEISKINKEITMKIFDKTKSEMQDYIKTNLYLTKESPANSFENLYSMTQHTFVLFCFDLLKRLKYPLIKKSGDFFDFVIDEPKMLVKCQSVFNVSKNTIEKMVLEMKCQNINKALIITNSIITVEAIVMAKKENIQMIDVNTLKLIFLARKNDLINLMKYII